jgi:hypothetical protein
MRHIVHRCGSLNGGIMLPCCLLCTAIMAVFPTETRTFSGGYIHIVSHGYMPTMKEIITVIKKEEGLHVMWEKGEEAKTEFFKFGDLIDMNINAVDLMNNPQDYLLDVENHTIASKKA